MNFNNEICDFGCDQPAIKYFRSTKRWCCSESVNRCPAKRKRDSQVKSGKKNPKQSARMKGLTPWNKGIKMPSGTGLKISKTLKASPNVTGRAKSQEKEELRKKKISESAKRNKRSGGYRVGSGRSRGCWYESKFAGKVYLDSSWELAYAKWLDLNQVKWQRCKNKFDYEFDGKKSNYIPDFYLIDLNLFVEIKGYVTERDQAKWKSIRETHNKELVVLTQSDLEVLSVLNVNRVHT